MSVPTERVDRVLAELEERGLDGLLVTGLVNVRWLTGFTGSNAAVVVGLDGTRRFLTDFRYVSQAAEQVGELAWSHEIGADLLALAAEDLPAGQVGFDDGQMPVRDHARLLELVGAGVALTGAGGLIEGLRAVKDAGEIERVRAACGLADAALTDVLGRGLAGRTEREIALDVELTIRRMGGEGVSFPPIVAAGPHGALPHAEPRDVVVPVGTLIVIDWGAVLDGYHSDCTRTYATGPLSEADAAIYAITLEAQLAGLAAVEAGPTGREVDAVARAIIDDAGHAEHFGHSLGHGVGLEIHEQPRLGKTGEAPLEAGMVVSVEPGIYVPDQAGVRIEDLVVVTADGCDVFTLLSKDLTEIPPAS